MYQLVLCLRYLRTRWIALASIISVTLGVATLVVVNAVMAGFRHEMQDRIHGVLSDLVFESQSLDGAADPDAHMAKISEAAGGLIASMSPTAQVPAMLSFKNGSHHITRQIMLIGIDAKSYSEVSDVGRYLQHPNNRESLDFALRESGYDTIDHQAEDPSKAKPRTRMALAGWEHRRRVAEVARRQAERMAILREQSIGPQPATETAKNPFAAAAGEPEGQTFDAAVEQHDGLVLGMSLAAFRDAEGQDHFWVMPGDDVEITYPTAARPPKPGSSYFTVVDLYESKMSDYDSSFAFVPLVKLQKLRGMYDPLTGVGRFNSIQIRCKPGVDIDEVRERLRAAFDPRLYAVSTWRDKQGPLLAAVQMETAVLNVLLFMIIAVAGFGILAIFYMIVVEKTRDIGILKSLGASGLGVAGVFLGYGLTLGIVGAGAGVAGGLLFVRNINQIADFISWLQGQEVFPPDVYFFQRIPTIVDPWTPALVALGALMIAVLASVAPAIRAGRLHPVVALRSE
ncbi:ABC transporter permease [Botrimarina hoheduenensis]|uniref:Lipoprotein-releasing system transmembrane protein LolE n=1 Tax=Botrimarina hoheduenensis TaxID=2528000 RepID=A0A5C5WFC7_9BACT|nr:FtsX-like permease family protein [Botrimarina hoheduenensis]TWT48472.1 Lipoprotein-releasing system transmembrane protein LolE [Botrimarina hoheduenensis]